MKKTKIDWEALEQQWEEQYREDYVIGSTPKETRTKNVGSTPSHSHQISEIETQKSLHTSYDYFQVLVLCLSHRRVFQFSSFIPGMIGSRNRIRPFSNPTTTPQFPASAFNYIDLNSKCT